MCGRFTLTAEPSALHAEFGINPPADWRPRYNIAPTQPVLAVVDTKSGWQPATLEWGLIPYWSKSRTGSSQRINARAESLADKPSFRDSFIRRRCLILADGFFEWIRVGKRSQPVLIRRADGRPFAFAGLWDRWFEQPDAPVYTCTIVTTATSDALRRIHDRMPVILGPRERAVWLERATSEADLHSLLAPADLEFEIIPVSPLVNSAANDGPEVLQPV